LLLVLSVAVLSGCSSGGSGSGPGASGPPAAVPRFRDVTSDAGLTLSGTSADQTAQRCPGGGRLGGRFPELAGDTSDSFDTEACQNERMTGGAAVGDVDGDGLPDLYVTRLDEPGVLFRNTGAGRFENVTATSGLGAATEPSSGALFADIDDDGDEDLFVTTYSGTRTFLFVNDGTGHFAEEGAARGVALADGSVHMGMSIGVGDYDRDGYVDLFTTEWRSPSLAPGGGTTHARLLHNRGAAAPGHFEDTTEAAGVSLIQPANPAWSFAAMFHDLDGDGWQDLAVTSDYRTSRLFWNRRDGTFVDGTRRAGVGTDENGMGSTIADYDRDGRPDWFVTGISAPKDLCDDGNCALGRTGNRLFRNLGGRQFTDVTSRAGVRDGDWGWGAAFVDATNTGRLDLAMTSGFDFRLFRTLTQFREGPMFYWVNRDGRFEDVTDRTGLGAVDGKGLLVADFDGDGRQDLLVVSPGGSPTLFRNVTPGSRHWLTVRAEGTTSNRDGFGAIVTVRVRKGAAPVRQEIGTVTGFLGESERTAHVGLGSATSVAEVRVHWPATGRENVLRNVPVDRVLRVVEPSS
jgi:hypothetical protein